MSERYHPWAVVVASLSLIFFSQGAMFILAVQLKPITADLGWPREAPSLGYSAAFFGAGVGAHYFGQRSERVGVTRIAALGAVSVAIGVYLTSLAREAWHVWASYGVFVGLLGNACMFTPLIANVARWFERHRGIALGLATCGQSLGGTIWPPVVTWVNGLVGWRETFQIYAAACLVVMIPLTLVLRRRPPVPASAARTEARQGGDRVLGLRPRVMTAALSFAIVCCCVPMSIPLVHLPAYGTDLGFAPQAAAALLSVALFASLASRVLSVIAFERDLWTLYAVCLVYGLGYGGIIAMYAYILREYFPPVGLARRMAVVYLFGTSGMAAGGWIGGRIFDAVGSYQEAFLIGVAINLVNLVVIGGLILRAWRLGALGRVAA
jgi:MFS family permease